MLNFTNWCNVSPLRGENLKISPEQCKYSCMPCGIPMTKKGYITLTTSLSRLFYLPSSTNVPNLKSLASFIAKIEHETQIYKTGWFWVVRGHLRSLQTLPLDRSYTTFYSPSIVADNVLSLYPHLSTKNRLFSELPTHYRRHWKLEINFSMVVLVQQHYVGKVGKSITFVFYIIPIYSVPNNIENPLTYEDTTVKWRGDCFSTHTYIVFWNRKSPQNSNGVTPYGGAKCRWSRLNAGVVAAKWWLSTRTVVNLVRCQVYHTQHSPYLFAAPLPRCSASRVFVKDS